ncbi:MAG TPA: hypothetical protein VGM50_20845, partial [Gemmatimonadaceae bacterium]
VPQHEIARLLNGVGFKVVGAGLESDVAVPSWRGDVSAEIDLIEEVARLRGYDSFGTELRPFRPTAVGDDAQWLASKRVRDVLVGAGMLEVRPMPFVAGGDGFVRVGNPLAENEAYLRRDVLDTLARRAEYNLARMEGNLRLFEIGSVFEPRAGQLPHEELHVAAVVMGRRMPAHFTDPKSPEFESWAVYDEWDVKALAERVAQALHPNARTSMIDADAANSEAGLLWTVTIDAEPIGEVRRLVLDAPVWAPPAFGLELTFGVVESADVAPRGESAYRPFERQSPRGGRYVAVPNTPASEFDLALLVPESVKAQQVEDAIKRVSGKLLEDVRLFDRYVGQGVEPGYRSLAWRLTFRHAERTLRDREIEARRSDILKALADELNVRTRTS